MLWGTKLEKPSLPFCIEWSKECVNECMWEKERETDKQTQHEILHVFLHVWQNRNSCPFVIIIIWTKRVEWFIYRPFLALPNGFISTSHKQMHLLEIPEAPRSHRSWKHLTILFPWRPPQPTTACLLGFTQVPHFETARGLICQHQDPNLSPSSAQKKTEVFVNLICILIELLNVLAFWIRKQRGLLFLASLACY